VPRLWFGPALLVSLALVTGACAGTADRSLDSRGVVASPGAEDRATLTGAGSTFAAPMVREWLAQYRRAAPGVDVEYKGGGSVSGVEAFASGSADFAVSEVPLGDVVAGGGDAHSPALEVPCLAGAVAVVYNLPGVNALQLSPATLAGIFSGRVKRWDDPSIIAENGRLDLPPTEIHVVHRSDRSGTTEAFTQFLSAAAPGGWPLSVGPTVTWPAGAGGEGSDGLIAMVRQTVGSIGYAAPNYGVQAGLGIASIENGAGRFVGPTPESVSAAVSHTNPTAPGAYPMVTVSFLVLPPSGRDEAELASLRHFAAWVLSEGQRSTELLGYARVPEPQLINALGMVMTVGRTGPAPTGAGP
jgi:phosphate transport system substrate-binding protein